MCEEWDDIIKILFSSIYIYLFYSLVDYYVHLQFRFTSIIYLQIILDMFLEHAKRYKCRDSKQLCLVTQKNLIMLKGRADCCGLIGL